MSTDFINSHLSIQAAPVLGALSKALDTLACIMAAALTAGLCCSMLAALLQPDGLYSCAWQVQEVGKALYL